MLIRLSEFPDGSRVPALLPPLLAMLGVLASGLGSGVRAGLTVLCCWPLLAALRRPVRTASGRRASRCPRAVTGWVDLAASGMLCWRRPGSTALALSRGDERLGAWGLALVAHGRLRLCLPSTPAARACRGLARQLLDGRDSAARWRPCPPGESRRREHARIGYNRPLRAPPSTPCPPS